jgi:two-component system, response regulator PdtaR
MPPKVSTLVFVDDDKIQHMINRKNLQRISPDLQTHFFDNPYEALDWLRTGQADLLILDVNMPEMQGWDFLDHLQKLGNQTEVKMLTSSMDPMDVETSKKYSQVSGFLVKPLTQQILTEILGLDS